MKFWDEMLNKYGFSDGSSVPAEAWELRDLYVHTVNRLAERNRSEFRIHKYDRPGLHNPCLIVFRSINASAGDPGTVPSQMTAYEIDNLDDAIALAIEQADELDLDSFIKIKVTTDWEAFDKAFYQAFPLTREVPDKS